MDRAPVSADPKRRRPPRSWLARGAETATRAVRRLGAGRASKSRPWAGLLLWTGCLCLVLWARFESSWILFVCAAAVVGAAARRPAGRRHAASVAALGAGVLAGVAVDLADYRFGDGWGSYWERRREAVAESVRSDFARLVASGQGAAERLAAAAASGPAKDELGDSAAVVLAASGATAVAVFDEDGALRAWRGSHRGRLPVGAGRGPGEDVAAAAAAPGEPAAAALGGSPLFTHLYFASRVPGGRGATVAASLVRSHLPASLASGGPEDFFARAGERAGERLRVIDADSPPEPGEFSVEWPGGSLRVAAVAPDAAARRAAARRPWVAAALVLAGLVWLLQSVGAPRRQLALTVGLLATGAALVPLEMVVWTPELADLASYSLPGPAPAPLGRLLLLGAAASPLVVLAAPRMDWRAGRWASAATVGAGFPLLLWWFAGGASVDLLGRANGPWIAYQLFLVLALALAAGFAFALRERAAGAEAGGADVGAGMRAATASWGLIAAGAGIATLLGFAVALETREGAETPLGAALLWALPAALVASGLRAGRDRVSFVGWLCAAWLAGTAALPFAWNQRTEARKAVAEQEIALLGILREPAEGLPAAFAELALELDRAGVGDIELLYRAWTSGGSERTRAPVFLTLWSAAGVPLRDLRLGPERARPAVLDRMLPALRAAGTRTYQNFNEPGVHRLAVVSLAGGRLATAAVPPRRSIPAASGAVPLLSSALTGGDPDFLALVRVPDGAPQRLGGRPSWSRNDEGWLAEGHVLFPDGTYAVAYTLSIPNVPVMLARAGLLLALSAAVLSALWLLGAGLLGVRFSMPVDWRGLFKSYRARVTWTLFGFFLLSSAIFGMLDYRTLSEASERTAAVLAERAVSEAAQSRLGAGGAFASDGWPAGADLLEYREGRLTGGSVSDLVDLGLYEGWVDPAIYQALESGQRMRASRVAELGGWRYIVAYQRLADGRVVAAPLPLRAGAAALRMRDVVHLLLFAFVLGPVLSLALAFFVGRALARPMQTLQVASERVGRGNLAVHLPEDRVDEFGSVFAAFNRMVLHLDTARQELLRTTRRTEAIVDAAPAGVVAIDAAGTVTAANPMAEALLAAQLAKGKAVPADSGPGAELEAWLEAHLSGVEPESLRDFKWGGRRIRGHARRIAHESSPSGVVVILEDMTDELRGERILAWGEMAQQVAHEVKNPLTPMKLSVQHLLRAWGDRRRDFGRILEENAGAVLKEIDRLAAVAKGFARLGRPGSAEAAPLEPVDAGAVVREVLALYRAGEGPVRVADELAEDLPRAWARPDELKEVLINLLENARAAMPGGGVVRVRAAAGGEPAGSALDMVVEDEGCGIPPELSAQVFEPQFSTRSEGTGLGLAIVKRIVDSWGGTVSLTSEPGRGAKVFLALRAATDE